MNIHMEATGELVSSPRERETREMKERAAIPLHSNVGNPSLDKRQIATRDKGQLSNRNLRDPSSYLGNSSYLVLGIMVHATPPIDEDHVGCPLIDCFRVNIIDSPQSID